MCNNTLIGKAYYIHYKNYPVKRYYATLLSHRTRQNFEHYEMNHQIISILIINLHIHLPITVITPIAGIPNTVCYSGRVDRSMETKVNIESFIINYISPRKENDAVV